jgi:hypothetical protein
LTVALEVRARLGLRVLLRGVLGLRVVLLLFLA